MFVSTILLLITAFKNERPSFLLPWIILQILSTVAFMIVFIFSAVAVFCIISTPPDGFVAGIFVGVVLYIVALISVGALIISGRLFKVLLIMLTVKLFSIV